MPEYLAPGVYVEETSFRAKTIEGVSTSTAAFVGPTRTGPVSGVPEIVTSFGEFERVYGGLDPLTFVNEPRATPNYLAHGVRAFFENGGQRLYVSRVYEAGAGGDGIATGTVTGAGGGAYRTLSVNARYPGAAQNARYVHAAIRGERARPARRRAPARWRERARRALHH